MLINIEEGKEEEKRKQQTFFHSHNNYTYSSSKLAKCLHDFCLFIFLVVLKRIRVCLQSEAEMILYTLIVRSKDGLALSASTDFNDEGLRDVKESKKYLKFLAKKAFQFPDRCMLHTGTHTI